MLPAGRVGRPPLKFIGLVHLEGDLRVSASFSISKLPKPQNGQTGRNIIEIYLSRPGGFISIFRNAEVNHNYGYHIHAPNVIGSNDVYERSKTESTSGRLEIKRIGSDLHFSRGYSTGALIEMGKVHFDSLPITQIAFQALAYQTGDGLDVTFDDIEIEADRIVIQHETSQPSLRTLVTAFIMVIVTLLLAGGYFYYRRGERAGADGSVRFGKTMVDERLGKSPDTVASGEVVSEDQV